MPTVRHVKRFKARWYSGRRILLSGGLLKEIENAEQEYLRLNKEKEELYQAARRAWQSGEVSQALSRMRAVLDLESKAPDTVTSGTYQTFYEKLHAEHDAINNAAAEARRHLADKQFDAALKICEDFLTRFPGQPSFRLLKSDIEEQQRQQRSAYIAEIDARLKQEADLDTKVSLLREALSQYPDEDHFKVRLRALEDRRDYYRATLERARTHEANGDFAAALADLDALDAMQGAFPGLSLERERLRKHVEHERRQLAFAAWTRKIDAQLESSNYTRAEDLVNGALVEFPRQCRSERAAETSRCRPRPCSDARTSWWREADNYARQDSSNEELSSCGRRSSSTIEPVRVRCCAMSSWPRAGVSVAATGAPRSPSPNRRSRSIPTTPWRRTFALARSTARPTRRFRAASPKPTPFRRPAISPARTRNSAKGLRRIAPIRG
jgi:tetratricopeptide (TPR) repeat protein